MPVDERRGMMKVVTIICLLTLGFVFSEGISYPEILIKPAQTLQSINKNSEDISSQLLTSEIVSARNRYDFKTNLAEYLSTFLEDALTYGLKANESVSKICMNDSLAIVGALMGGQTWAQKVVDAYGKIPNGILDGNIRFLGAYDECVNVRATVYSNPVKQTDYQRSFKGKFCSALLMEGPKSAANPEGGGSSGGISYDLCVPDSCTSTDVLQIINSILAELPRSENSTAFQLHQMNCQHPDRKMDTGAIVVLVFVIMFFILMILATLYDILAVQIPKSRAAAMIDTNLVNDEQGFKYKIRSNSNEDSPLLGEKEMSSTTEPGRAAKFLLSFSVYTNAKKVLDTNQAAGSLTAVNGIRFLSMSWVILGHSLAFGLGYVTNVAEAFPEFLSRWTFQAISNALVSVDSFFVLSGLLVSYLTMREMKRRNGKINWFMFYFHRFWRLTPPYMLLMLVYVPLFPYMYNGPYWSEKGVEPNQCKNWYLNLLYVNNFAKMTDLCMGWSWYLANDMQFFILSPIILLPLYYSQTIGMIVLLLFILGTTVCAGVLSTVYKLPASMFGPAALTNPQAFLDYFVVYYIKPYCRFGPYLVGMVTGYILYKTDCKVKINRYLNILGWLVAATLAILIVYGLHDEANGHPLSQPEASLYNSTHRTVWGICLCWVIFTCATGNGGFVNTLLSWKAFVPLSRLTYCAYLIHPIIMYLEYSGLRYPFAITDLVLINNFLGQLLLSYMGAFVLSLTFESPMMGLEKVLFRKQK